MRKAKHLDRWLLHPCSIFLLAGFRLIRDHSHPVRDSAILAIQLAAISIGLALGLGGRHLTPIELDVTPLPLTVHTDSVAIDGTYDVDIVAPDAPRDIVASTAEIVEWKLEWQYEYLQDLLDGLLLTDVQARVVETDTSKYRISIRSSTVTNRATCRLLESRMPLDRTHLGRAVIRIELKSGRSRAVKTIDVPVDLVLPRDSEAPQIESAEWVIECSALGRLICRAPVASDNRCSSDAVQYRAELFSEGGELLRSVGWSSPPLAFEDLPNSVYSITMRARDTVGNESKPCLVSTMTQVNCPDIVPPVLLPLQTSSNRTYRGEDLKLVLGATDNSADPNSMVYFISIDNNDPIVTSQSNQSISISDGLHRITVQAMDPAGNLSIPRCFPFEAQGYASGFAAGPSSTFGLDVGLCIRWYAETVWPVGLCTSVSMFPSSLAACTCVLADVQGTADFGPVTVGLGSGLYVLPEDSWSCLTVSASLHLPFFLGVDALDLEIAPYLALHPKFGRKTTLLLVGRVMYSL